MMLFDNKEPTIEHASHRPSAGNSKGWRQSILNPFRLILRITEYLAGPPVHEEINTLQEEAEKWRRRVAAVEAEREGLQQQLTNLERDQDRQRHVVSHLRKERDELSRRAAVLEQERCEVKEYIAHEERAQDAVEVSGANPSNERQRVTMHETDLKKNKGRVNNVRESLEIQPGTFALLNEEGDDSGYGWNLLHCISRHGQEGGSILECAQKAVYDSVKDQVLFCGGPQPSSGHANRLLRYDIAANKWTVEPAPDTWGTGCAYDTNTLNFTAREMYVSSMLRSNALRRLHLDTATWSTMAQPDSIGFVPSEPSAEYFPEREELLWLQTKRLGAWNRSSNTWRLISPALQGLRWRSAIARYNPVLQSVLILGGGDTDKTPPMFSHAVYVYDRKGKITRLKDSPPSVNVYINHAIVTVDPVGGDFLVIQAAHGSNSKGFTGGIEFWKYRMDTDTWTSLDPSLFPAPSTWWPQGYPSSVLAVPIAKYGVVLFMSAAPGSKSKVYLYRHS